jgi:hypothetical protein
MLLTISVVSLLASVILHILDSNLPDNANRLTNLSFYYVVLILIIVFLSKKYFDVYGITLPKFEKIILIIFIFINLLISAKLFTTDYLMNTLDFGQHELLINYIKEFQQPFLHTRIEPELRNPFYPLGGLYQLAVISHLTGVGSIEIMKFSYILISSFLWPVILWLYIQSFSMGDSIKNKIWIIGLTFNHMPYGYFYWGHLPTVLSILLAMYFEIISSKFSPARYWFWVYICIANLLLFIIHPVGTGTLIMLLIIRNLVENRRKSKNEVGKKKNPKVLAKAVTTLLIILIPLIAYSPVIYQVKQNLEKLINGKVFNYDISIWDRFINFTYEWIVNIKYQNSPILDTLYIIILASVVLIYYKIRYVWILITQIVLILSTAASQQVFPISLIAIPTFPFYSSASRMSHLTIIVYVLVIGKILDLKERENLYVESITNKYFLSSLLIMFNLSFYISL